MTYARFLGLFVVLPIILLALRYRRTYTRQNAAALGVLLAVVYAATIPWDNLAVKWGLWHFRPDLIWGLTLGYLPLEEYLFFGLQTVLVGLWVFVRLRRVSLVPAPRASATSREAAARADSGLGAKEVAS
jgi:lycopene beta-cyclase